MIFSLSLKLFKQFPHIFHSRLFWLRISRAHFDPSRCGCVLVQPMIYICSVSSDRCQCLVYTVYNKSQISICNSNMFLNISMYLIVLFILSC